MGVPVVVQKKIAVIGYVQGVSYRKQTLRVARRLGITGWVRNVSDGSVEACFEGEEAAVAAMIAWCAFGPQKAKVDEVSFLPVDDQGGYGCFEILTDRNHADNFNLAA
jgi:acylphosphatase